MSRYSHLRRAPRNSPVTPPGIFDVAVNYRLFIAGQSGFVEFDEYLKAAEAQRQLDPKVTWLVRIPGGVVLNIRNGSSSDLRKLVQRHGGHL